MKTKNYFEFKGLKPLGKSTFNCWVQKIEIPEPFANFCMTQIVRETESNYVDNQETLSDIRAWMRDRDSSRYVLLQLGRKQRNPMLIPVLWRHLRVNRVECPNKSTKHLTSTRNLNRQRFAANIQSARKCCTFYFIRKFAENGKCDTHTPWIIIWSMERVIRFVYVSR